MPGFSREYLNSEWCSMEWLSNSHTSNPNAQAYIRPTTRWKRIMGTKRFGILWWWDLQTLVVLGIFNLSQVIVLSSTHETQCCLLDSNPCGQKKSISWFWGTWIMQVTKWTNLAPRLGETYKLGKRSFTNFEILWSLTETSVAKFHKVPQYFTKFH